MKVLLIIDMQNDFILEDAPFRVKGALSIIGNIRKILGEFRKKDRPIFHIMKVHKKDGSDIEITRKERFNKTPYVVDGTRGAEIIDELRPKPGEEVVKKTRMDSFFRTDLDSRLRRRGVTDLIIVGIQTANCIRSTAVTAVALGYNTAIVEDATAAPTPEIQRTNIFDMNNMGISIVKTADILAGS